MNKKPKKLKLREDFTKYKVVAFDGLKRLFESSEYKTTAEWVKNKFDLSDEQLFELYASYKKDYDKRK